MATIQDVARSAGVSTATVSRVLSAPEVVAEATRARVLEAVNVLGYAPNVAAKMLRTLRTEKILVTVPDISNPFFSQVIRGVEEAASAAGYSVLLGDTRDEEAREEQFAAMLRRKEADGLIFLGHRLPDTLAEMVAAGGPRTPIVNGCEYSPDLGVSSAHIDNERATAEAIDHLYGLGHSRVGVITGPLVSPLSRDRLAGVQNAAVRRGLMGELAVATGDFSLEAGARPLESGLLGWLAVLADPRHRPCIRVARVRLELGPLLLVLDVVDHGVGIEQRDRGALAGIAIAAAHRRDLRLDTREPLLRRLQAFDRLAVAVAKRGGERIVATRARGGEAALERFGVGLGHHQLGHALELLGVALGGDARRRRELAAAIDHDRDLDRGAGRNRPLQLAAADLDPPDDATHVRDLELALHDRDRQRHAGAARCDRIHRVVGERAARRQRGAAIEVHLDHVVRERDAGGAAERRVADRDAVDDRDLVGIGGHHDT